MKLQEAQHYIITLTLMFGKHLAIWSLLYCFGEDGCTCLYFFGCQNQQNVEKINSHLLSLGLLPKC